MSALQDYIIQLSQTGMISESSTRRRIEELLKVVLTSPSELQVLVEFFFERQDELRNHEQFPKRLIREIIKKGLCVLSNDELVALVQSIPTLQQLASSLESHITSAQLNEVWWDAFAEQAKSQVENTSAAADYNQNKAAIREMARNAARRKAK